jgi:hypothetical protein
LYIEVSGVDEEPVATPLATCRVTNSADLRAVPDARDESPARHGAGIHAEQVPLAAHAFLADYVTGNIEAQ